MFQSKMSPSPPLHPSGILSFALLMLQMMPPLVLCRPSLSKITLGRSAAFVTPPCPPLQLSSTHQRLRTYDEYYFISNTNFRLMASDPTYADLAPTGLSEQLQDNLQIEQLSTTTNILVFIIGIIPFLWAAYEFWRRIAVGASFGTGSDSVIIPSPFAEVDDMIMIGEDNNPNSSRGRRTLDRGALTVAYVLFAVAAGSVAIAVASVVTSPQAPL
jgi:hypothetical protein